MLQRPIESGQRALVALHTPATGPPDVDAVTYWEDWQPEPPGEDVGRRMTRVAASQWPIGALTASFVTTVRAVLVASGEHPDDDLVASQTHVLTVSDLCSTLAVEATVHHLDLQMGCPSMEGLSETRRVLDGLLGRQLPLPGDVRYALVATGREVPDDQERSLFGSDIDRLPLFG